MRLTTFTVEFEVGPETRALIERLVEKTPAVEIELGPRTRQLVQELAISDPQATAGAIRKLANAYRNVRR